MRHLWRLTSADDARAGGRRWVQTDRSSADHILKTALLPPTRYSHSINVFVFESRERNQKRSFAERYAEWHAVGSCTTRGRSRSQGSVVATLSEHTRHLTTSWDQVSSAALRLVRAHCNSGLGAFRQGRRSLFRKTALACFRLSCRLRALSPITTINFRIARHSSLWFDRRTAYAWIVVSKAIVVDPRFLIELTPGVAEGIDQRFAG